jgi:hypothetical protein
MPDQDVLTVDEATTIHTDGHAEFTTRDALIRPGRHKFADFAEFRDHLVDALGAKADGEGLRGTLARKGSYSRRDAQAFGDPVLDAISSPEGTVVIGGETIDLRASLEPSAGAIGSDPDVIAYAAPNLKFTGIVNGAERWATDDRSWVEYRLGTGRLYFHAWKKSTIYQYWSMGAEISIINTPAKFKRAHIESQRYISISGPCQMYDADRDSDRNDTYLDEYSYGWNSQQPERTASLCQAIWHNQPFADLVTAGEGCDDLPNQTQWPPFPPEWTAKITILNLNGDWTDGSSRSAAISTDINDLKVDMSKFGRPAAKGSITGWTSIEVTFPDDRTYTGELVGPGTIRWSNNSTWTKIVNTVMDLNGSWTDGSERSAVIYEGASAIKVDMSDYDRPNASGSIVDGSTISVKFPDDRTYTAQLHAPNTIRWSNGSVWTKKS